jgi:LysR family glycine cleavage system transcriptional activator
VLKLPPLRSIEVFEVVGRTGSISRAAEELGVSPSAVTQQIHILEKHLGVRLVQRNGRGIEITSWGSMYWSRVTSGFQQLRRAQEDVDRAQRSRHLIVSALPSLATKWLGPLLFDWKQREPMASVLVKGLDHESKLDGVEADFRISYGQRRRGYSRSSHLFTDHVIVVASPSLLARVGPIRQPSDLRKQTLLWIDWGVDHQSPPTWRDWFPSVGVSGDRLKSELTFSLSGAAIDAAIEGRGFALAQYSMVASALAQGHLQRVFAEGLPLPESYFLAWNGAALDTPTGAAFHAWLLAEGRRFDVPEAASARGPAPESGALVPASITPPAGDRTA